MYIFDLTYTIRETRNKHYDITKDVVYCVDPEKLFITQRNSDV